MKENFKTINLFDLTQTIAKDLFTDAEYPWEVLPRIKEFVKKLGEGLSEEEYIKKGEDIWIAKSAKEIGRASCRERVLIQV